MSIRSLTKKAKKAVKKVKQVSAAIRVVSSNPLVQQAAMAYPPAAAGLAAVNLGTGIISGAGKQAQQLQTELKQIQSLKITETTSNPDTSRSGMLQGVSMPGVSVQADPTKKKSFIDEIFSMFGM